MSKTKLKPCPFCGEKDVRLIEHALLGQGNKEYYVNCLCGARFYSFRYKKQAMDAWNKRAN